MRLTTLLATMILSLLPAWAMAQCESRSNDQQAMSCLPGTAWDEVTGTCLPVISS